ncbi:MAG: thioredoxin family protein [Komagataeibacter hansenii]|nr:thioredoxin family protein [Novacetimonas hansenii]
MKPGSLALALLLATVPVPLASACMAAGSLPQIGDASVKPVTAPYGPAEGAQQAVDAAFALARQTGRRVLLDFGANWCPDCRIFAGVLTQPDVAPWIEKNFVVVPINVNRDKNAPRNGERYNSNADIARKYGVVIEAIPAVLVFTPDGQLVNRDDALVLGDARSLTPQAMINQLDKWAPPS